MWIFRNCFNFPFFEFPSAEADWMNIAEDFKKVCQHIVIIKPKKSGSYYFNYKGFYSVVLFVVVNANYEIIYVHCRTNGRVSDGGVLQNTDFGELLEEKS